MPKEYKLPDLGEGIHEGEIVEVLVSVGDRVEDGQPILLVETDKATTEVPSPVTGFVEEIRVKAGDVVKVGDVLMTFREEEGQVTPKAGVPSDKKEEKAPVDIEREQAKETERAEQVAGKTVQEEGAGKAPSQEAKGPVPAAPSTRRLARELKVDLSQVSASGPGGRVTSEDVREYAEKAKAPATAPKAPEAERRKEEPSEAVKAPPLPEFDQLGRVEHIPLRSIRRATAKQMALSWSQIPHVTHQDIADITELEAFRRRHKGDIEEEGGALSITIFILKVVVAALKAYPQFNSSIDMEAEEIIYKRYYNIGVAVDTPRGLIVPVVRDVDRKSIRDLSRELKELSRKTRDGKSERDDMSGGTFTITNIGSLGGTGFTPIINYPQAAILGMGRARLKPVVRGEEGSYEIVPRLMLPLVIGFDHRVADGADAARFLKVVIDALEDPERLLMTI